MLGIRCRDPTRATFIKLVRPTFLFCFFFFFCTGERYVSEEQKLQQTGRALFSSVPTDEKRVNDSRTRWYHKLDGLWPFPPPSPAQVCATAFWNNDHRRAVFAHIRRVLEGVKLPLRRKKSLDIYISVYIRICENFIECGRVQVRFDGGEILKLIPRSYVFHFYKLCKRGESLFSLVFYYRRLFFYERYLMMFDLKITIDESGL